VITIFPPLKHFSNLEGNSRLVRRNKKDRRLQQTDIKEQPGDHCSCLDWATLASARAGTAAEIAGEPNRHQNYASGSPEWPICLNDLCPTCRGTL